MVEFIAQTIFATHPLTVQLRFEMINVFNRHYFGGVDLNLNNATFGNIRTANGSRTGQLGARIEF